jgi:hypothetical protein
MLRSTAVCFTLALLLSWWGPETAAAKARTYLCIYEKHPVSLMGQSIMKPSGSDTFEVMDRTTVRFGRREMKGDVTDTAIQLFGSFDHADRRGILLKHKHTVFINVDTGRYNRFSQIEKNGQVIFNEIVSGRCEEA